MPSIFNIRELPQEKRSTQTFDMRGELPDAYEWLTSPRLGKLAGSKSMAIDVRTLLPKKFSFPYHFHRASEEFFLILSGTATLRTPQGFRSVKKDDLVFFEEGAESAHQLYNHSDEPCVYLDVRASNGLDVAEYPDTGKINVLCPPTMEIYETSSRVEYFKGEQNIADKWPEDILKHGAKG